MNNNKTTRGKKPTQKAYMAAFIDGEGCISLYKGNIYAKHQRTELSLYISNTHKETIDRLQEVWGGRRKIRHQDHPKWKTNYILKWASNKATDVLKEVLPYMITKKKQAELAINFQKNRKFGKNRYAPITKDELKFACDSANEMKRLNADSRFHPQRLSGKTPEKVKR